MGGRVRDEIEDDPGLDRIESRRGETAQEGVEILVDDFVVDRSDGVFPVVVFVVVVVILFLGSAGRFGTGAGLLRFALYGAGILSVFVLFFVCLFVCACVRACVRASEKENNERERERLS